MVDIDRGRCYAMVQEPGGPEGGRVRVTSGGQVATVYVHHFCPTTLLLEFGFRSLV